MSEASRETARALDVAKKIIEQAKQDLKILQTPENCENLEQHNAHDRYYGLPKQQRWELLKALHKTIRDQEVQRAISSGLDPNLCVITNDDYEWLLGLMVPDLPSSIAKTNSPHVQDTPQQTNSAHKQSPS